MINERFLSFLSLYNKGLNTPDCVGYHGTSLETVQYFLTKGIIPGFTNDNDERLIRRRMRLGDICFYPRILQFPDDHPTQAQKLFIFSEANKNDPDFDQRVLSITKKWAKGIAQRHCFLSELDLAWTEGESGHAHHILRKLNETPNYNREDLYIPYLSLGFKIEELDKVAEKALKRQGVILGLSTSVLQFEMKQGYAWELILNAPGGLDLTHISGIYPIGLEEQTYFNSLVYF